jgi:O-antigen ligase
VIRPSRPSPWRPRRPLPRPPRPPGGHAGAPGGHAGPAGGGGRRSLRGRSRRQRQRHVGTAGLAYAALLCAGILIGLQIPSLGIVAVGMVVGTAILLTSVLFPVPAVLFAITASSLGSLFTLGLMGAVVNISVGAWWLAAIATISVVLFRRQKLVYSRGTYLLLAYVGYVALSSVWASEPLSAIKETIQLATFVPLFIAVENFLREPRELERGVTFFVLGAMILILGTMVGTVTRPVLPTLRVFATGGALFQWAIAYFHPVTVATIAGTLTMLIGALFLGGRGTREQRIGLALLLGVLLLAQALLFKRSQIIALAGGGLVLLFFYGWKKVAVFSSFGALAAIGVLLVMPGVRKEFQDIGNMEEGTAYLHLVRNPVTGLAIWAESPIFGKGTDAFHHEAAETINELGLGKRTMDPEKGIAAHNWAVRVLAESGLIGAGLLLWFLFEMYRGVWRGTGRPRAPATTLNHLCRGILAGMCLQMVVALFQNVHMWTPFWLLMALGYRAAALATGSDRGPLPAGAAAPRRPAVVHEVPPRPRRAPVLSRASRPAAAAPRWRPRPARGFGPEPRPETGDGA